MPVLNNIGTLATCAASGGQDATHELHDASVAWQGDTIRWVGASDAIPRAYRNEPMIDAGGALVVPGLVDCHTHLAFGGWRADEFALRARGATYQEIAASGGGIRSTMRATRAASEDDLVERSLGFLAQMTELGVTTVEAKSGYGLSLEEELKLLRVYREVATRQPADVVATLLAAHVVPPEFDGNRSGYVAHICGEVIPAAEGMADFCDVFVEEGAFTANDAAQLMTAAANYGMRPKLHVDQLGDGGGGTLAASLGAASADHLEHTSAAGIQAMAAAGVVAVSLPIASLYLRQPPMRARAFVDAGCDVAVATDFNPGSAPSYHLPFAMTLACTMNGLTPAEVLKGATLIAARAIGREKICGSIEAGKRADLIVIAAAGVNQWLYHLRPNAVTRVFVAGECAKPASG